MTRIVLLASTVILLATACGSSGVATNTSDAANNTQSDTISPNTDGTLPNVTSIERRVDYANTGGSLDFKVVYTLNASKQIVKKETYTNSGKELVQTYTYTYTPDGSIATERVGDLSVNRSYDANGRLTEKTFVVDQEIETFTYAYDNNGRLTQVTLKGVGVSETFTYDESGRLTSRDQLQEQSGAVRLRETYSYDANGRLEKEMQDDNGDGSVDACWIYTYDSQGRNTQIELFEPCQSASPYAVGKFLYNGAGLLEKVEIDREPLGSVDETWTFDDNLPTFCAPLSPEQMRLKPIHSHIHPCGSVFQLGDHDYVSTG